jgi:predicted AlkP superfamily phosphohydrolase/phosphomutase
MGFTRSRMGPALSRLGLSRLRGALRAALGARATLIPNDSQARLSDLVDWRSTRAYSMGYIGQVFVNLAGREPEGIVQPGREYERVLDELTEALLGMPDPDDGRPIVDKALRRAEVYSGPYLADAPDLFVIMRGLSYITRESYEWSESGKYVLSPPTLECADHRPEGVLIMSGPGVAEGRAMLSGARIIDVTPTILHLLGLPVPSDMDGQVLTDLFVDGQVTRVVSYDNQTSTAYQATDQAGLSSQDEADLIERLRNLGYVE